MITIDLSEYTSFIVTGKLVRGGRFRNVYSNGRYAFGINLWNGSVYGIRKSDGKRKLLKRVVN
jgi:hypothetical protein